MKNIKIKIALFLGIIVFGTSCNDEFLIEEPRDSLFGNTLFENKDGFRQAVNSLYALVRKERTRTGGNSYENSVIWKTGTDTAWGNYTYNSLRPFDIYGTNLTPADGTMNSIFNWLYDVVNATNTIITRAESSSVNWQGGSDAENMNNKNQIVAQARLFRAWAYRHLTGTWGAVPLSLEEIDGDTFRTYWERTPLETIQLQMEQDLLFAEANLPSDYNDPTVLSSAVAQHYLAELYLTMGGQENYKKAEIKAEAAIANPNFKLITQRYGANKSKPGVPFMDQFNEQSALPSQGNTEVLWVFLNALDLTGSGDIIMRRTWVNRYYYFIDNGSNREEKEENTEWVLSNFGGRGLGRAAHTLYLEDLYEDQDDRYSEFAFSKYYIRKEDGDTIFTKVPTFSKWKVKDRYWPGTKKWDGYPTIELVADDRQYGNMPYVRLSETYLLAAEAEFRLGKLSEAKDHINAVRTRSNATPITAGDVSVEAILDERALELFSEEHRRYTLNRFGLLVSRTKLYNKFTDIEDKNILYPLPQNFIDSNQGTTAQNPGWGN